ncbi:RNA polymerase factor sigma-54 [Candidatus Saganbacteria bacterium]|nr:RNA polymerase factor sigma-54 [Candidatus Saganbacteria bacterium]
MALQQDLRQTLELQLAPRLLQMLKILSLPYADLVERITKESEENPALEVERRDEYAAFLRYLTSDRKIKKEADFGELPGLASIGKVEKSLIDHLLEQLSLTDLEDDDREMAKRIIDNIDDFGFVIKYTRLRDTLMKEFDVSRPTVDKILKVIQTFEPEGVGARDLKECLLIQIEEYSFENPDLQNLLRRTVEQQLDDLGRQDYKRVAANLGIPESGAAEIANFIKNNLNANPGASFGGETKHVLPSFAVEKTDTGFKLVNLETRYGPVVNLAPRYLKMLDDPKTDAETKKYLKEKIKKAKELIDDFSKRSETLEKIVRKIIDTQQAFLQKGGHWLEPLTQKSLAGEFGLHPSTISRTVASKYIQTPQGLFPLKVFCPRGRKGFTASRLKALLAALIKAENLRQPLTDSQLTERLKRQGAKIDRRTVAYYRKELGIQTAFERKGNDEARKK